MGNIRYGLATAFVTGLALFAAGCSTGGGDSGKDSSAQGSGEGKKEDDGYEYRQCLRDNGVKVEEPKEGMGAGITVPDEKALKKAQEA
ncbi:hypothetical protein ACIQU6_44110 [Streptomyces sp. NPDC090442]|uniref:hypothetical protein n=1 Tax=Streptomyces sp. NPDC090442 TaxID=3365962 RepID=UPI0037FDE10A